MSAPKVTLMASGNTTVIAEMREIIKEGKPVDIQTRDRLLFTAVIDIYEHLEPMIAFYKIGIWFFSGLGLSILGLIGGIITGKVELVFK